MFEFTKLEDGKTILVPFQLCAFEETENGSLVVLFGDDHWAVKETMSDLKMMFMRLQGAQTQAPPNLRG